MSKFKEVLKIEKNYQKIISTAKTKSEKKINEAVEELGIREETMKKDLTKQLNTEMKDLKSKLIKKGEKEVESSKEIAKKIIANSDINKAVDYLMGEFKNGF